MRGLSLWIVALLVGSTAACRYDRDRIPTFGMHASPYSSDGGQLHDVDAADVDVDAARVNTPDASGRDPSTPDGRVQNPHTHEAPDAAQDADDSGDSDAGDCPKGTVENPDHTCSDIDECSLGVCDPQAFCTNTFGSFVCKCPAYFTDVQSGRQCVDTRYEWAATFSTAGLQAMPIGEELLVVGTFAGQLSLGPWVLQSAGANDVFIGRLDADRHWSWVRQFGGPNDDVMYWATLDHAGDVIVTGPTGGGMDFGDGMISVGSEPLRYLAKFHGADGSFAWKRTFANMDANDVYWEGFVSIDASNNVLLAGEFENALQAGPSFLIAAGGWDACLVKVAPDGTVLWGKGWGGAGLERVRAVVADSDRNIVLSGDFTEGFSIEGKRLDSAGGADVFLTKLTADGNLVWAQALGGSADDIAGRMAIDSKDNVLLAGSFQGTGLFGSQAPLTLPDAVDSFLGKWSPDGVPLWRHRIGGSGIDIVWGVAAGPSDEMIISGRFERTIDFGEGPRASKGNEDAFVTKYDAFGELVWDRTFGGPGHDTSGTVRIDAKGRVYPSGWFDIGADLGAGPIGVGAMYIVQLAP